MAISDIVFPKGKPLEYWVEAQKILKANILEEFDLEKNLITVEKSAYLFTYDLDFETNKKMTFEEATSVFKENLEKSLDLHLEALLKNIDRPGVYYHPSTVSFVKENRSVSTLKNFVRLTYQQEYLDESVDICIELVYPAKESKEECIDRIAKTIRNARAAKQREIQRKKQEKESKRKREELYRKLKKEFEGK